MSKGNAHFPKMVGSRLGSCKRPYSFVEHGAQ